MLKRYTHLTIEHIEDAQDRLPQVYGQKSNVLLLFFSGQKSGQNPTYCPLLSFKGSDRKAYNKAVEKADLGDFNFHDLRHCAINNLRLAGNDHFLIKQASGHKTDVAFRRYNLVTEDEMKGMKWYTEKAGETGSIDTYMDTTGIL